MSKASLVIKLCNEATGWDKDMVDQAEKAYERSLDILKTGKFKINGTRGISFTVDIPIHINTVSEADDSSAGYFSTDDRVIVLNILDTTCTKIEDFINNFGKDYHKDLPKKFAKKFKVVDTFMEERSTFIHEYIHYLNHKRYRNYHYGYHPTGSDEYYNEQTEIDSHYNQAISNVLHSVRYMTMKNMPISFNKFQKLFVDQAYQLVKHANHKTKQQINKRLYTLYNHLAEKELLIK